MLTVSGTGPDLDLDPSLPVLLLRIDRNIFHHGTLGAVRSLGRAGIQVHAVVEGGTSPVARSRYLHRSHPWRPSMRTPELLLEYLASIALSIGRRTLLVPMDDAGAIFVAEHADALAELFVFPRTEPSLPRRLADKSLLSRECERLGIPYPESLLPQSAGEVEVAVRRLGLPLIAKFARPWNLPQHSAQRSTVLVRTRERAQQVWAAADAAAAPLILQRHIAGAAGVDWFFQGYFDSSGRCSFGAVGRKDLSFPRNAGHTVLGRWLDNPEVETVARTIAGALGYRGIADLDLRYEVSTDTYYLLDFNPRLGAQFRIFSAERGLDLVRAMHLDLSGRSIPETGRRYGRAFIVENHYLRLGLTGRVAGASPAGGLGGSGGELAWFAMDDPVPCTVMWIHSLIRAGRRGCAALLRGRSRR